MKKILLVIDMQNDFIDGALGSREAAAIVEIVDYATAGASYVAPIVDRSSFSTKYLVPKSSLITLEDG